MDVDSELHAPAALWYSCNVGIIVGK